MTFFIFNNQTSTLLNYNIYNSLILAGIVQGIIFGFAALQHPSLRHRSSYFLLAVVLVYSLSNLQFYLCDIGWLSYEALFRYFYVPWGNLVPPLLYFYVLNYLDPERRIKSVEKWLFAPFLMSLLISLVYKIAVWSGGVPAFAFLRNYMESIDELISAAFHLFIISLLIHRLTAYKKKAVRFEERHIKRQTGWLRGTLVALLLGVLVWIAIVMADIYMPGQFSFYPLWIIMATLIYWLGHIGIYKHGIIHERLQIRKRSIKRHSEKQRASKNILIERLDQFLVQQRQFMDPDLTLERTAQALDVSKGHLSKVINQELQMGFKDFVNNLRVEEAKKYLLDDSFSNYTLLAIGLEAGFNSKSAFNASFKKIAGQTPSQFKMANSN